MAAHGVERRPRLGELSDWIRVVSVLREIRIGKGIGIRGFELEDMAVQLRDFWENRLAKTRNLYKWRGFIEIFRAEKNNTEGGLFQVLDEHFLCFYILLSF